MTDKPVRFRALDAWRGISALLVAMEHLNVRNALHRNALVEHGFRFVDFFFVLSGFVISHAYREPLSHGGGEVRRFLVRRVGRLWPLHLVILTAFVLFALAVLVLSHLGMSLGHATLTERNTVPAFIAQLFLVQGLGGMHHLAWNGPAWSVSTELFAYALFALVCVLAARRVEWCAGVLAIAGALIVVLFAPHGMGSTYDYGFLRCVYGFMTGVLVRSLYGWRKPMVGTFGEVAVVAAVGAAVIFLPLDGSALLVTPVFALAVYVFAAESGTLSRLLLGRGPQALGAWSYSIYMVHVLVALGILTGTMLAARRGMHTFMRIDDVVTVIGPTWFTTVVIVAYLAIVVGIASVTYRFVELPGQRLFGRWARCMPSGS